MTWLELLPYAPSFISSVAVFLSAWTVGKAIQHADRQFALSYIQEVNKWAVDVLTAWNKTRALFGYKKTCEEQATECNIILAELSSLKDAGLFLFPADDADPQQCLQKMIDAVFSFQNILFSNNHLHGETVTMQANLRADFIGSVRAELKVAKRVNDVHRYLK